MESAVITNTNFKLHNQNQTVLTLRTRNKKLTFFFQVSFLSLFLFSAALITYLVLDIFSESEAQTISRDDSSSIIDPIEGLNVSLHTAATHLNNTTLFLDFMSNDSTTRALNSTTIHSLLKKCTDLLRAGLSQIVYVLGEDQSDLPETAQRIGYAEGKLNTCLEALEDLEKLEHGTTVVVEAKTRVLGAYLSVRRSAGFVEMIRNERDSEKHRGGIDWRQMIDVGNLVVMALVGLQLFFIAFLFWTVYTFPA